jgi:ABC-type proline/glycine betaine transport system permease subunit
MIVSLVNGLPITIVIGEASPHMQGSLRIGPSMKTIHTVFVAMGLLLVFIGLGLAGVQCDQLLRNHRLLEVVRQKVAVLEKVPRNERDDAHAQQLVWGMDDVEYFEKKILPRDCGILVMFLGIIAVGATCSAMAISLTRCSRGERS